MYYDIFRELCAARKVSPKKAVTEMGLSNSLATKWKNTGAVPTGETLAKVANYFNVTVDFLITGEQKKPAPEAGDGLDAESRLYDKVKALSPELRERAEAYLDGLLAGQEK